MITKESKEFGDDVDRLLVLRVDEDEQDHREEPRIASHALLGTSNALHVLTQQVGIPESQERADGVAEGVGQSAEVPGET